VVIVNTGFFQASVTLKPKLPETHTPAAAVLYYIHLAVSAGHSVQVSEQQAPPQSEEEKDKYPPADTAESRAGTAKPEAKLAT
jgi:hypothetical protein